MSNVSVFIQANARQLLAARVAAFSIRRAATSRDVHVRVMQLENYPALHGRQGQTYLRGGRSAVWRNDTLQSFTPLRFLPPSLMGFDGRALVIDPDVFAVQDITELLDRDMNGAGVLARRIVPSNGRDPYWASSVMLLDCARLRHWDWEAHLGNMFAGTRDYRAWMSLELEPEGVVAPLEPVWNDFDTLTDRTRLLHNTSRITQPWKTGLPVDFDRDPVPGLPLKARAKLRLLELKQRARPETYQPHPDPRQETFFFELLRDAIDAGAVTRDEVEAAAASGAMRKDALALVERVSATTTR